MTIRHESYGPLAAYGTESEATAPTPGPAVDVRPLTLVGVSRDGARVLLVDSDGAGFSLAITPDLTTALGAGHAPTGDAPTGHPRTGHQETTMDSALRPRDIQARIRAGETPEAVAEAGHTTVEKIMAFVGPVLAERQHVAERAQRATLRRTAGEAGPSRVLGEAVDRHLRGLNVDPATVTWDAWRREDGRWSLSAAYDATGRTGEAHLTFDAPGNYVLADDDDARWLVGDAPSTAEPAEPARPAPARDDLGAARERRLGVVPGAGQDELPLGDDAIELVADSPVEAWLDAEPDSDDPAAREDAADAAADEPPGPTGPDGPDGPDGAPESHDPDPDPDDGATPAPRRAVQKKKGRASVPSWDEIMFGGGDN